MAYKILENNGIDIENIDGGAFNNLAAGNKSGIVGNVLNECALTSYSNNVIIMPGLLILHGIRVKITEAESLTISSMPASSTTYQIVAQVTMNEGVVTFSIFAQLPTDLIKDNLFVDGGGTYQIELGRFVHNTNGTISDVLRTAEVIYYGFPDAPANGRQYVRKDGEWVDISDTIDAIYLLLQRL